MPLNEIDPSQEFINSKTYGYGEKPEPSTTFVPPAPNPQMPSIGRIVHYVPIDNPNVIEAHNNATEVPAIVVRVWNKDVVNLKVFTDGIYDTWKTSIRYSAEKEPNSWHWPEPVV